MIMCNVVKEIKTIF